MATYKETEPLPVGQRVRYEGSVTGYHGEYTVVEHRLERLGVPVSEYPEYTDGVAYDLWPLNTPQTFANREYALYYVRRASITPITE